AEVRNLFIGQDHESRFGQIQKWVLENVVAVQADDLVRLWRDADARKFMQQPDEQFVRIRVIVVPRRVIRVIRRPMVPGVAVTALKAGKHNPRLLLGPARFRRATRESKKTNKNEKTLQNQCVMEKSQ